MRLEKYVKNKHYPILLRWFDQYGWEPWHWDIVSPYSWMAYVGGKPTAFTGFYAHVGTKGAQLAFTIGDKNSTCTKKAVNMLMRRVRAECKKLGIMYLHYTTERKYRSMMDTFIKHGGTLLDETSLVACMAFNNNVLDFMKEDE